MATALALSLVVGGGTAASAGSGGGDSEVSGTITVLAASSLTEAFTEIGERFERKHPDATLNFSFGSSSTLVTQIQQGAPTDVIATADQANMDELIESGDVDEAGGVVSAHNRLAIAVAPGNPLKIKTLADTLDPEVTLVLCVPEAPCGKYALETYANADLPVPSVPTGANAKDTMAKVALGEADAAIVYVTDVKGGKDDVDGVAIPRAQNVEATYPIDVIVGAPNPVGAKAFSVFVQSKAGQKILRRFGFVDP